MMNDFIEIIQRRCTTDEEAFSSDQDVVLASVRAEKSYTGMNESSKDDATFATQTAVFRFRCIPGLRVEPSLFITDAAGRYNITAVDEVSGRGMYLVVTAQRVAASEG